MHDSDEFKEVAIEDCSQRALQELGDQGWELIAYAPTLQGGFGSRQGACLLRRPPDTRESWEYHSFNLSGMPPEWHEHIGSCGWTIVDHPYYVYYGVSLHFAKRPSHWRGTDDGDILARLSDMGWELASVDHPSQPDRYHQQRVLRLSESFTDVVRDVLSLKWLLSEEEGHNVGTYSAVRYWLAHRHVPLLLEAFGVPMPARPPERVLDDLLSLRSVLRRDDSSPRLTSTVRQWVAHFYLPEILRSFGMPMPDCSPEGLLDEIMGLAMRRPSEESSRVSGDAVHLWLADVAVPQMLKAEGISVEPGDLETLLHTLLEVRLTLRRGDYVPSLREAARHWKANQG